MNKKQILLVGGGIAIVIALFSLPKSIVSNKDNTEQVSQKETSQSSENRSITKAAIPDSAGQQIKTLVGKFNAEQDIQKRVSIAKELIEKFKKFHQFDSAAKYSEEVALMTPNKEALEAAGDLYFEAFNFAAEDTKASHNQKARKYYQMVIDKDPKDLDVKSKLAMTFVGGEETMKGVKLLKEVMDEDPKNESAIYNLGILSLQSGQNEKALKRFKELTEINPRHSGARFYLGLSYMNTGNKKKAREEFEMAKSLDSDPEFNAIVDGYIKELSN